MKILITGVTGFAGTHLANFLAREFHDLDLYGTCHHLGRDSLLPITNEVKLTETDINYFESVEKVLESVLPDIICHFAAYVSVAKSFEHPALTFQTNAIGTINFLEATKKVCKGAKILIPGSAEVYGNVEAANKPVKETQLLNPQNPYALSKTVQEMLGIYYSKTFGLDIYLTRTFHYTGPGQPLGFVCSDFARQIAESEQSKRDNTIKVGNLKAKRDFTDIRDVVRAYWEIIDKGKPNTVYNVCTGRSISIEEILSILLQMSSCDISVETGKEKPRLMDVPDFVGDNSKLERDTSWRPQIEMKESLRDLLNFWRSKLNGNK